MTYDHVSSAIPDWTPCPDLDERLPVESWPDDVFVNPVRRRGPLVSARYVELVSRAFSVFADSDDERDLAYPRLVSAARYFGVPLAASSWKDLLPN